MGKMTRVSDTGPSCPSCLMYANAFNLVESIVLSVINALNHCIHEQGPIVDICVYNRTRCVCIMKYIHRTLYVRYRNNKWLCIIKDNCQSQFIYSFNFLSFFCLHNSIQHNDD